MKNILLLFFFFVSYFSIAQTLVKDIQNGFLSSNPSQGVAVNGTYFFAATDGLNGIELWKSDGTEIGTTMVLDINTSGNSDPQNLISAGGLLYFTADDGISGRELWVSDGSVAGTNMIDDIFPGIDNSNPSDLTWLNGVLYFSANDGSGSELYKYNGSVSMVKDINPAGGSNPSSIVTDGSFLYFTAEDGTNGIELWWSDGSTGGTNMVADINTSGNSSPYELTTSFGQIYFGANDGSGDFLYQSDGTTTQKVLKLACIFGSHADPSNIIESGGVIYFISGDVLYKIINASPCTSNVYPFSVTDNPTNFIDVNGLLFFMGSSGGHVNNDLWISDGTGGNTLAIKSFSTGIGALGRLNGVCVFDADDVTNGREIWISNGTVAGTILGGDINPGAGNSNPGNFMEMGDDVFFQAINPLSGVELWKYNLPCSQTFSPVNYSAGTHTATNSATDTDGWTNYCDGDGNLLLSLKLGSSGAVIPNSGVSIKNNLPAYIYYAQFCGGNCFISNPDGAAFLNNTWDVQPTTQPSSDVDVRFYLPADLLHDLNEELDANDKSGVPSINDLKFYKITNGSLPAHPTIPSIQANDIIELSSGSPSTTNWQYGTKRVNLEYYAEMKASSFSGGGGGGAPLGLSFLPIELTYFRAKEDDGNVQLSWASASEINSKHFEIQKSQDGINWITIHLQNAQGFSNETTLYNYMDKSPFAGINYYRLKMVDLDDTFEFSNIETASIKSEDVGLFLSPNPAQESIDIQLPDWVPFNPNTKIKIYNSVGVLIQTVEIQSLAKTTVNITDLRSGLYFVEFSVGIHQWTKSFFKL